ncbi:MAG TPA: hypothetical protein VFD05_04675 [Bacilli bacterium]|nr:hypothetical protein [Bacilli bacterium]
MKPKNMVAGFLLSLAALTLIVSNQTLSKEPFFQNLMAENNYYEVTLPSSDFMPLIEDEYSGVFSNGYIEFFYLSHDTAIMDEALSLKAKDHKTPGVFVNKTVINGLISVKVEFSGGPLYAIATSSFYERYEYDAGDALTSGEVKTFSGDDLGYLLILSPTTAGAEVTEVKVKYSCAHETDQNFFYDPYVNRYTGARSWGVNREMNHDYIEFTTNPQPTNNNYSIGKTDEEQPYNDDWYRWNGVSLRNHRIVDDIWVYDGVPFGNFASNSFEVIISAIIEPSVFYDLDAWFQVAPWVALDEENPEQRSPLHLQTYIGNDNYDPLGGIKSRTDTYRGRFYTTFSSSGGGYDWGFVDPDVATLVDSEVTLREAYEATNLPFFNVRFEIIENSYAIYINGFKVHYVEDFMFNTYEGQKYIIDSIELQGVNYGLKDGSGGTSESEYEPYRLTYFNPIVREIIY